MLIEQITYVLHPGKAPALVAAYEQGGAAVIQASLGRMIAFMHAEVGGMDEVKKDLNVIASSIRNGQRSRVPMGILFTAVFSGIEIIWDRQFGFLKETLVAPVPRLEIVLGRTLGSATVALIQGSIGI